MAEDGAWPSLCLGPPSQRLGEQIRVHNPVVKTHGRLGTQLG